MAKKNGRPARPGVKTDSLSAGRTSVCDYCGKAFIRKKRRQKFCSRDCVRKEGFGNTGRPTKMELEVINKLEEVFSLGGTDKEACLYAGISATTLWKFQQKNPAFKKRKEALKATPILASRQEVVRGFSNNPDFSLKYLERKRKKEFGLRVEVTGKGGRGLTEVDKKRAEETREKLKFI